MNLIASCFRRFNLVRPIALGYATLVAAQAAHGGPMPEGNLLAMLQYATGIAIVEVVDCKPFDPSHRGETWEPQQSATCKVREVLAGSPPDTFQVAIYLRDIKTGDRALAFIGRRPNHKVLAKEGHEYLFYMSGGFRLLNKLVKPGEQGANASALAAIKEAAQVLKPPIATFPMKV